MRETLGPSMELLDVTAGEQAGYCVHARLLLHWVNSLPLIKCLLVEELSDLRFGDVLLEIVEWLQSRNDAEAIFEDGLTEDDVFENGEVMERLRRVVQFVARECRSQDEDAMHIVNNAECVAQVLAGQSKAICAVLTVLKRLGVQRWKEQQSLASEKGALRRRQVHKEMLKLSLHSHDNAPQDKLDAESERKRNMPYVTSEQIHVVNEWLTRVGFDMKKSSGRGVLQDPMRNGVLFCSLLTQVLQKRSFSYIKRPRTLSDMRENISTAFIRLGDFPQEQIPPCFLTSSAEQAVLIGDRQINYGILWHLWQASHRTHVEGATTSPKGLDETRAVGVQAAVVPSPPMTSSPFLLDIPAIVLAEQGKVKASFQVKLHDSFARRLEWSANDPSGNLDDDDVFPVPRAPFSSPVYTVAVDSVSAPSQHETEEKYQDMDDILPAPSHNRNTDALSSPSQVSDNRAPRIEIEELSAAVAFPMSAYPDSAKSPTQASDSVSEMPSPAKKLETHGDQNFVPSQTSVEEILAWLKRLGIHLKKASTFHDSSAKLTEFQSGVLLCCIVEKVELMRSIPGITRPSGKNQLSKASALHNISKALAILQQKKTMPLHLLRRANAIYAGNREIILQLLLQIRKAYGHHHVPRRRSNQHSPAA
ncbi:uncharacterized protein KRP23_13475 [Phytophthora ramorum]|uniref:uncharacterized protein n=1 Tax=Phytophthora ramorum TaxID=164328 RepID=UPI0030A0CE94|nr:hypothetical protein KRP23_13475 [Phytophthora ramorum]